MERCYLYGVVRTEDGTDLAVPDGGMKGAPVSRLEWGGLAALVSPLGEERVRSSRADLSAHERVVEHVAARTTVLPLQFGIVLPDGQAVIDQVLEPMRGQLTQLLADLAGKSEHRLKATYIGDVALFEAIAGSRPIRRLQDRIRSKSEAASYAERIQLGELVAAALEQMKADDEADVVQRLGRYADATVVLPTRRDDVAMHAAFLVDHAAQVRFDEAVDSLARHLDQRMSFELIGPLAPWDFVSEGLAASSDQRTHLTSAGSPSRRR
jgi:hypothetical protein